MICGKTMMPLLLWLLMCHDVLAQQFVVVSTESGVPVRDVLVYTDNQQSVHSAWDGTFTLTEGFHSMTLQHPGFEKRIMEATEIEGDTIWLIPSINALREVVVYGQARSMTKKAGLAMSKTDLQLLESRPQGFSPFGLIALLYDELWGKKQRHRAEMKRQKQQMIMDNY